MRELKRIRCVGLPAGLCRTPPGVRELKLWGYGGLSPAKGRTPPGVRELKRPGSLIITREGTGVAPLPGCVN